MSPLQLYQQQISHGILESNPQQLVVMNILEEIYQHLFTDNTRSWKKKLKSFCTFKKPTQPPGLYLWGSVGAGKTHLINLFYQCAPNRKRRQHFHIFMQDIQQQLALHQGQKNPLIVIANEIAAEHEVLILDEFIVNNIADAMILSGLLGALFEAGVCLITNSNTQPDNLYANGLQREQFLPAIALIKQFTQVIHLDVAKDYRLRSQQHVRAYYTPLSAENRHLLEASFAHLIGEKTVSTKPLSLYGRKISIYQQADGVIWLDFHAICGRPRSTKDYIALCQTYHTFIISDVPALATANVDEVLSFINLIDILYDEHRQLILSAAVPIIELYSEGKMRSQFMRTESRIMEMQSAEYFSR